ncbi:PRELI domain containing 1a isoform X1 [Gasterosteus aculeatus]
MVKYFCCAGLLRSSWDQVCIAFWQRYPNPYSNHVLTEDIIFREVTPTNCLKSRRLLTKTSRAPRWMEPYLPKQMASSAYIIEDSIVDPQKKTMTTLTWNISHARLMVPKRWIPRALCIAQRKKTQPHVASVFLVVVFCPSVSQCVEERCEYQINRDNGSWTEIRREAWISSNIYGLSRAIQEFGLARFKTSVTKTMKGFEYVLSKMQGETPSRSLAETATERARETALAAKEKAKDLASQAQKKQYV